MQNEAELIGRIRAGDDATFAELVAPHTSKLLLELEALVGDRAEAEDILQDALLKAWIELRTFRGEGPFGGWLRTIAKRMGLRALRKQSNRRAAESVAEPPIAAGDPERTALAREQLAEIERVFRTWTPEQQEVFLLRMQSKLTFEQIAAQLGVSVNTALGRMHTARRRLRELSRVLFPVSVLARSLVGAFVAAAIVTTIIPDMEEPAPGRPIVSLGAALARAIVRPPTSPESPVGDTILFEGNAVPDGTNSAWVPVENAVGTPSFGVVTDPRAEDGLAFELIGFRMFWHIPEKELREFDNTKGWTFEARHFAVSNSVESLDVNGYSDTSDHVALSDGVLFAFIDFRPGQVRVKSASTTVPCSEFPHTCKIWNVPSDEYVTVWIEGQGTSFTVVVNDEEPWVAQLGETFGPTIAFGNTTTGVQHRATSRWDYIRWNVRDGLPSVSNHAESLRPSITR